MKKLIIAMLATQMVFSSLARAERAQRDTDIQTDQSARQSAFAVKSKRVQDILSIIDTATSPAIQEGIRGLLDERVKALNAFEHGELMEQLQLRQTSIKNRIQGLKSGISEADAQELVNIAGAVTVIASSVYIASFGGLLVNLFKGTEVALGKLAWTGGVSGAIMVGTGTYLTYLQEELAESKDIELQRALLNKELDQIEVLNDQILLELESKVIENRLKVLESEMSERRLKARQAELSEQ